MTNSNNLLVYVNGCCTPQERSLNTKSENNNEKEKLPVAIIGAGPVGLAAAAHLVSRGQSFIVLEGGSQVGANILTWGHIRLFSPWRYNVDKVAKSMLEQNNWTHPELEKLPTGKELVEQYLEPLSNLSEIQSYIQLNTKVLSIGKKDTDKMKTQNRENIPFIIHTESNGSYKTFKARAVIDATGTWGIQTQLLQVGYG